MIEVIFVGQINRTVAWPILVEGQHQLMEIGLADPVQVLNWDDEGIIAKVDGKIAGALAFSEQKFDKTLWVKLGYVRRLWRREGVYRALWDKLVEIARERKAAEIQGAASPKNKGMLAFNAAVGREVRALQYAYKVEQKPVQEPKRTRGKP